MDKFKCSNCEKEISLKQKLKILNSRCPYCNEKLKISNESKAIYALIAIFPLVTLASFKRYVLSFIWIIISIFILQPIIYKSKK